jgi:WD40 repeat protein
MWGRRNSILLVVAFKTEQILTVNLLSTIPSKTLMKNLPPRSLKNTFVSNSETTGIAIKQLSFFGYAAAGLTLLATGFILGSLLKTPNLQLPGGTRAAENTSQACSLDVETLPNSSQPIEAQVELADCAVNAGLEQVKVQTSIGRLGAAWWVEVSPDGRTLATVSGNVAEIRDFNTQEVLHTLEGHTDVIHAIAISSDGKTIATGGADKVIKLWNLETGELLQTLVGHVGVLWSVAFTPDGQTLASGGGDSTIRLWDLKTGQLTRTLTGHQDRLFPVAFSPDGQILASGSKDTTIKLWDWQTGRPLRTLSGHTDAVRTLAFDPTGEQIASGSWDGTIKLWDVQTGEELNTFLGHVNNIISVTFSPDGKTLASGGIDHTIKLWDLNNQTLLATLNGHLDWVLAIAFSPDGTLVSGGRDGTIAIWRK